jgi:hypothetical protein
MMGMFRCPMFYASYSVECSPCLQYNSSHHHQATVWLGSLVLLPSRTCNGFV